MRLSYAQNSEDIMLWRVFRDIAEGFYIDVGANDPDTDSVTRLFYERGWRGINIEPVPRWAAMLREKRARDINLEIAVGASAGKTMLFELADSRLSTICAPIAEDHMQKFGMQNQAYQVNVETLTDICERYAPSEIHFIKIDVEGGEGDVIRGLDIKKYRPWIFIIEATIPCTNEFGDLSWESHLFNEGYECLYFDGLNRFYVSPDYSYLKQAFRFPPNIADGFVNYNAIKSSADEIINQRNQIENLYQEMKLLREELQLIKDSPWFKIDRFLKKGQIH